MFGDLGYVCFEVVGFSFVWLGFFNWPHAFDKNKWHLTVFIQITQIIICFTDQCSRAHYKFAILHLGSFPSQINK